jgi:ketosteroid isomerase-like protein
MAEKIRKDEETRIRTVVQGAWSAIGAKDAEKALSHYARDRVQYSLAPPLRVQLDATALNDWFATWRGPIGIEIRDLAVHVSGDVAFCTSLNRMTGTKTDGAAVDLWFRATMGLRERGGEWKIVHEHESVPFYMDGSFRAAVDLKPTPEARS